MAVASETLDKKKQKVIRQKITLPENITVKDLARRMAVRGPDVVKKLIEVGVAEATLEHTIDHDIAELIVSEFGHCLSTKREVPVNLNMKEDVSIRSLQKRPPIVTVLGHVNHGKTSLLDTIRQSNIVAFEAGGITQHVGAYQITVRDGQKITFIDTPGHVSFKGMRARGSSVTDIVVLVIAADDGIQEQTIEAISHAKIAKVPIVVAINKIDKPNLTTDSIRRTLLEHEVILEEFGGDTLAVEISAKSGLNIEELKEKILVVAEMMDLKANLSQPAIGVVIESKLDKARGALATVLVQDGSLRTGNTFVAGQAWGRVRALINEQGKVVTLAYPSQPVEVCGMSKISIPGDDFFVVKDETMACKIVKHRCNKNRRKIISQLPVRKLFESMETAKREVFCVVKGDAWGSVEAILSGLKQLSNEQASVCVLSSGIGTITQGDVNLIKTSLSGKVIGFNVQATHQASSLARSNQVEILYYSTVYSIFEDIKSTLADTSGQDLHKRKSLGQAEVRKIFNISGGGKIAGCFITDGVVKRSSEVQLLREGKVIYCGKIKSLKRVKSDVTEVRAGFDCGISLVNNPDFQEGDLIRSFGDDGDNKLLR